jgi:hypothetical protein
LRGPFPYEDLRFAYRVTRNEEKGTLVVAMGLSVLGEDPVFPVQLSLGPNAIFNSPPACSGPPHICAKMLSEFRAEMQMPTDLSAVYMNVTRDGTEIGMVGVATGLLWSEFAASARRPTLD